MSNGLASTMRGFTDDFMTFMGIAPDTPAPVAPNADRTPSPEPAAAREEAAFGEPHAPEASAPPCDSGTAAAAADKDGHSGAWREPRAPPLPRGRTVEVMTPRGPIVGAQASPFTQVAFSYAPCDPCTGRAAAPMPLSVAAPEYQSVPYAAASPFAGIVPSAPPAPNPQDNDDVALYTAPSTLATTSEPGLLPPSYEPAGAAGPVPRGRGHGREHSHRHRKSAHPAPAAPAPKSAAPARKEDKNAVEMDDLSRRSSSSSKSRSSSRSSSRPPAGKRCIVHRDGRREYVDTSDPRLATLPRQKHSKGGQEAPKKEPAAPEQRAERRPSTLYSETPEDAEREERRARAQELRRKQALAKAVRPKPYFTISVTLLQIALFIFELCKTARTTKISFHFSLSGIWSFGGASTNVIIEMGGKYSEAIVHKHEWWRFITPIFLHVSIIHIVFNLLTQIKIGIDLERTFGSLRAGILYILCGIGGNLLSACFLYNQIQAGASGAIFGQLGLMFVDVFVNWKRLQRPVVNLVAIIIIIILCVISGMMPGVDNFAHVGGLVVGLVGGFAFMPHLIKGKGRWARLIVVCITFPLLVAIFGGLLYLFYGYVAKGNNIDCEWCESINCAKQLLGEGWCKS